MCKSWDTHVTAESKLSYYLSHSWDITYMIIKSLHVSHRIGISHMIIMCHIEHTYRHNHMIVTCQVIISQAITTCYECACNLDLWGCLILLIMTYKKQNIPGNIFWGKNIKIAMCVLGTFQLASNLLTAKHFLIMIFNSWLYDIVKSWFGTGLPILAQFVVKR